MIVWMDVLLDDRVDEQIDGWVGLWNRWVIGLIDEWMVGGCLDDVLLDGQIDG